MKQMQIMQACCGVVFALIAPALVWAQATPATVVEPPRQQMQTVAPNVPVGPYLVNVTGKTFVNDAFLDIALSEQGRTVPDGTNVTFDAALLESGKIAPPSGTPVHLTATTMAGHAKLAPPVDVEGDWGFTITVAGPAGSGTSSTPLKMGIDPHSPPASLGYRLSQIAIPVVSVVLLLAFFRLRRIELERRPSDRSETIDRSQTRPHFAR
jgi:hypothetical protein